MAIIRKYILYCLRVKSIIGCLVLLSSYRSNNSLNFSYCFFFLYMLFALRGICIPNNLRYPYLVKYNEINPPFFSSLTLTSCNRDETLFVVVTFGLNKQHFFFFSYIVFLKIHKLSFPHIKKKKKLFIFISTNKLLITGGTWYDLHSFTEL